ncbi:hypothetical protein C487_16749 [Natrinema pallidum DSM 3751]|uniref:Uncharacterized protein n=1 Tax=Natrinema pallidum DSM 3751 TaxID=1227495 RepID=L9YKS3_9EURY|nr:hypothetical protein C487_16749 [Natrinema pallidum DSM 3751]
MRRRHRTSALFFAVAVAPVRSSLPELSEPANEPEEQRHGRPEAGDSRRKRGCGEEQEAALSTAAPKRQRAV